MPKKVVARVSDMDNEQLRMRIPSFERRMSTFLDQHKTFLTWFYLPRP